MRILISGSSGFLGRALCSHLSQQGHQILPLLRNASSNTSAVSLPSVLAGNQRLPALDAVIHLAGAPLMAKRWTSAYKKELYDSRVSLTHTLAEVLAHCPQPPRVLVSASAAGVYGDRGDEPLGEQASPGQDWLAQLCVDWEAAAQGVVEAGTRVVHLRTGIVLGSGGALARMLPAYRLHLGGRLGTGKQFMPWIHMTDVLGAIELALQEESLSGAINLAAPQEVRNADFSRQLASHPGLGELLPVPALALRMLFGQAAQVLLASQRMRPLVLQKTGYVFQHAELESALAECIT